MKMRVCFVSHGHTFCTFAKESCINTHLKVAQYVLHLLHPTTGHYLELACCSCDGDTREPSTPAPRRPFRRCAGTRLHLSVEMGRICRPSPSPFAAAAAVGASFSPCVRRAAVFHWHRRAIRRLLLRPSGRVCSWLALHFLELLLLLYWVLSSQDRVEQCQNLHYSPRWQSLGLLLETSLSAWTACLLRVEVGA